MERKRISIEIGHTYAEKDNLHGSGTEFEVLDRALTPFENACAGVGDEARAIAEHQGLAAKTQVLVDDVEWAYRQPLSQDSWRWQLFRGRAWRGVGIAYPNSEVSSEGDLRRPAEERIANIEAEAGKPVRHMRLQTHTGEQRVKLRGYGDIEDTQHPSCDMLDFEWHAQRAAGAHVLVTVLHEKYMPQQARVHALATHITGTSLDKASMATLFLDDSGRPTQLMRWKESSPEARGYFDTLESSLVKKED